MAEKPSCDYWGKLLLYAVVVSTIVGLTGGLLNRWDLAQIPTSLIAIVSAIASAMGVIFLRDPNHEDQAAAE